jgi:hypothetical protein
MALSLTKAVADRNRNVPVQKIELGLDFTRVLPGARLAEGAYIAVQVPEQLRAVWRWQDWVYEPADGRIVRADDPAQLIPYNYFVIGLSRMAGP